MHVPAALTPEGGGTTNRSRARELRQRPMSREQSPVGGKRTPDQSDLTGAIGDPPGRDRSACRSAAKLDHERRIHACHDTIAAYVKV
jgi:hypothetical protein